jgi:hypothetical protein
MAKKHTHVVEIAQNGSKMRKIHSFKVWGVKNVLKNGLYTWQPTMVCLIT